MFYDPRHDDHGLPHNPWTALVAPRPIGWISSLSPDGTANLAPYSFFNAVAGTPPFVMFSSTPRKDSLSNIEETGEFVVNIATWDLREKMNQSSATYPAEVDEFEAVGLEKAACRNVAAPRVAASPISIECILNDTVALKPRSGLACRTTLVIGEVVGIHIDEGILKDGILQPGLYRPLSRLGYMDYAATDEIFAMARPIVDSTG